LTGSDSHRVTESNLSRPYRDKALTRTGVDVDPSVRSLPSGRSLLDHRPDRADRLRPVRPEGRLTEPTRTGVETETESTSRRSTRATEPESGATRLVPISSETSSRPRPHLSSRPGPESTRATTGSDSDRSHRADHRPAPTSRPSRSSHRAGPVSHPFKSVIRRGFKLFQSLSNPFQLPLFLLKWESTASQGRRIISDANK